MNTLPNTVESERCFWILKPLLKLTPVPRPFPMGWFRKAAGLAPDKSEEKNSFNRSRAGDFIEPLNSYNAIAIALAILFFPDRKAFIASLYASLSRYCKANFSERELLGRRSRFAMPNAIFQRFLRTAEIRLWVTEVASTCLAVFTGASLDG